MCVSIYVYLLANGSSPCGRHDEGEVAINTDTRIDYKTLSDNQINPDESSCSRSSDDAYDSHSDNIAEALEEGVDGLRTFKRSRSFKDIEVRIVFQPLVDF